VGRHGCGVLPPPPPHTHTHSLNVWVPRRAFGAVYKAKMNSTGEVIAAKCVALGEEETLEELQKEIDILRKCQSPACVRYYGCVKHADELWVCNACVLYCVCVCVCVCV
jgi:serine/threonine protein kinase